MGGSLSELALAVCAIRAPEDAGCCVRSIFNEQHMLILFWLLLQNSECLYISVIEGAVEFVLGFFS